MAIAHPRWMFDHAIGFESVEAPVPEAECNVRGALPNWLRGRFVHSGPAQFQVGDESFVHWFDGLAMLSSIEIDSGSARYRSRYLQSEARQRDQERGRIAVGEFDTSPKRSWWGTIDTLIRGDRGGGDNGNVNVLDIGGRFITLTETTRELEFDPRTLETVGELHHDDDVAGVLATPHPHIDTKASCSVSRSTHANTGAASSFSTRRLSHSAPTSSSHRSSPSISMGSSSRSPAEQPVSCSSAEYAGRLAPPPRNELPRAPSSLIQQAGRAGSGCRRCRRTPQ